MKRNINCGFTLIETVISLMLLSFITIIGYQGLVFGMEQWRNGHDKMQFQYDFHQAIGWARNKIGSAEKVLDLKGSGRSYLFSGADRSVEFVARYDRSRRGGQYVTKILYAEGDTSIYVYYHLHHPDMERESEDRFSERVKLLSEVASLRFSYYGSKGGKAAAWHDDWVDSNTLPQLVKIHIQSVDGVKYVSTVNVLTSNNV